MTNVAWLGEPLMISNSEIQTYKDCPRKWWLVYYRELRMKQRYAKPTGAANLGTIVHIALAALYAEGRNPVDVLNEEYARVIAFWSSPEADDPSAADKIVELKKEQDLGKAMLEGYSQWIAESGADEGLEVVATETVIEAPLRDIPGVILRGKLDQRVIRKTDNARLFLDHKTVGNLTDPPRILPMDQQMKFYHLLEKLDSLDKTGGEPQWRTDGALYNMLRKVKRTATAKPPFYDRLEVHHNEQTLKTTWVQVTSVVEALVRARQNLDLGSDHHYIAPPRASRDCTWKCEFFPICPMFDDGSNIDGLIEEYYEHGDPHERYREEEEIKS